jgi:hypothetical protein
MSETAQKLLEQIRALPEADREWIAHELNGEAEYDDPMDDPEFQAMLTERLDEVKNHPERLLTLEEANAQIDAELARRRAARGEQ